jgi:hypothetical protein
MPTLLLVIRVILDGIEYFDLLYIGDPDKVYVIQVKKGFGGKTRESCSQIRNSAKMIESSRCERKPQETKGVVRKN